MEQPRTASTHSEPPTPTLSICISTFNRAEYLRETLKTILPQLTQDCELLVVDNASPDNTPQVVSEFTPQHDRLRYMRMDTNKGMDGNFDRVVELAEGDYCWLASDDDFFKPGAVAAVLKVLTQEPSAVLVNYEFKDLGMSKVLQARALPFDFDRIYGPWELDRMFVELGDYIRYIGAIVISRAVWRSRCRTRYLGSGYHFVGMLYQERFPRSVHVLAEPYVSYRYGNVGFYSNKTMELVFSKWPSLVASLPLAEATKRRLHSSQPWKHPFELLLWRGIGSYSYEEYRHWVRPQLRGVENFLPILCSVVPRSLANMLLRLYLSPRRHDLREMRGFYLVLLEGSPHNFRNWKLWDRKQQATNRSLPRPSSTS